MKFVQFANNFINLNDISTITIYPSGNNESTILFRMQRGTDIKIDTDTDVITASELVKLSMDCTQVYPMQRKKGIQ